MGGPGSGDYLHRNAKRIVDGLISLDARRLAREKILQRGYQGTWRWMRDGEVQAEIQIRVEAGRVLLKYGVRGDRDAENQHCSVEIERTPCNFGGSRVWFRCPETNCRRRAAILYFAESGLFSCRRCCRLTYASTREDAPFRAIRRADRIRARLCWEKKVRCSNDRKPKGMHWQTYERLAADYDTLVNQFMQEIAVKLKAVIGDVAAN